MSLYIISTGTVNYANERWVTTLTDCNVSVLFFIKKVKETSLIIIRPVDRGEGILH